MNLTKSTLNSSRYTFTLLGLTLMVSLLLTVWISSSHLWDKYRVVTDVQDYYWLALAQDPTLFVRDYLFLSTSQIIDLDVLGFRLMLYPRSLGHALFYYLVSTVIDPVWLFKLSILLLIPLCVVFLFKLGQFLEDNLTGVSLALIFTFFILASPISLSVASGLPRGFAIPILVLFLYYLIRKQFVGAGVMIVVSSLVYLPCFPPVVLTYALSLVKVERPFKVSFNISRTSLIPLVISLLISSLVVALALAAQLNWLPSSTPVEFISTITEGATVSMEEVYQPGGSVSLFLSFPFLGRAGIFNTGGDVTNFLVMLVLAFLIYKAVGPKSIQRIPAEVWWLLAAGFIMYAASLFVLLGLSSLALYFPSRYTRSALFMVMLFFVGLNWIDFLSRLPNWLWRNRRQFLFFLATLGVSLGVLYFLTPDRLLLIPTFWFLGLIASGVLVLVAASGLVWLVIGSLSLNPVVKWSSTLVIAVAVVYLASVYVGILGVKPINPSSDERNIYEFVASLPKDTVLVGNPDIMTNIPLFSRRSVLFKGLFPRGDAPIVKYFDAQYAETTQPLLDFCQQYQTSYLVVDIRDFDPDYLAKQNFFYEPWNSNIITTVNNRTDFIIPKLKPVFTSGPFMVIKCDEETMATGK